MKAYTIEQLRAMERDTWSEDDFGRIMFSHAKGLGWTGAHFRPAMTGRKDKKTGKPIWITAVAGDGKGFPDWLLFKLSRKLAWELKVEGNTTTPEQDWWLNILEQAGFEVAVCYPKHWNVMMQILES